LSEVDVAYSPVHIHFDTVSPHCRLKVWRRTGDVSQTVTQCCRLRANAVVTCEIKHYNYFKIIFRCFISHATTSEIISKLFRPLKLFQNNFRALLQRMNILQRVQCRRNYFEMISELFQRLK